MFLLQLIITGRMNNRFVEAIIVGAGHAGLSVSFILKQLRVDHMIVERGRIGESWRSQRWDSFCLNTANKLNVLPGQCYTGDGPENFATAKEFATTLQRYAEVNGLPVKENTRVLKISRREGSEIFSVYVSERSVVKEYNCSQIIICSGGQSEKKIPSFTNKIAPNIIQLHASEYRNASQLPEGAVLIAGTAQSGCQICEDLLEARRKVFLATSLVPRIPRRYRGKDIMDWLLAIGFLDLKTDQVTDPKIFRMPTPQVSGTGEKGHTVSLQQLASLGAVILGKMEDAHHDVVYFNSNGAEHVQFADGFSNKVKDMVDEFILKTKQEAEITEEDIADRPDPVASCVSPVPSLSLVESGIRSIIWSTGFNKDMSYIDLPVFDENGVPRHKNGVSSVEGLYFLGLPWLRSRKSGIIMGITEDAEFIANKVHEYAQIHALKQ